MPRAGQYLTTLFINVILFFTYLTALFINVIFFFSQGTFLTHYLHVVELWRASMDDFFTVVAVLGCHVSSWVLNTVLSHG